MDSAFYASCAGLRAQSQALEVLGHNLANLNTVGFRGQETTFESLLAVSGPTTGNVLNNVLNKAANNFGVLEGTRLDTTAGNLSATGNPLDLAIEGSGYFAIQTEGGTRYTRNGSFQMSSTGQLVTAAGDAVLSDPARGANATIRIPAGPVTIAPDGTISVNGAVAGKIELVEFAPGTPLVSEGGTLLAAPEGSAVAAQQSMLKQGSLESSNVNSITAVVQLIGVQRQAEMMQRAMTLIDTEFNHIASSDLAKV
jgi:flagellar basal-body rod protein FlgF/flagellar basal-body rod protein FlgG